MKIYGSEATLICPDPNMFDGEAVVTSWGKELERIKADGPFAIEGRGVGLAEMALAQKAHRPHRVNDELAYHVLDIMCAITESAEQEKAIHLTTTAERPAPFCDFQ
jgi:predicted dehydrogenase